MGALRLSAITLLCLVLMACSDSNDGPENNHTNPEGEPSKASWLVVDRLEIGEREIVFTHGEDGRLKQISASAGPTAEVETVGVTFAYDEVGQWVQITGDPQISTWDNAGIPAQTVYSWYRGISLGESGNLESNGYAEYKSQVRAGEGWAHWDMNAVTLGVHSVVPGGFRRDTIYDQAGVSPFTETIGISSNGCLFTDLATKNAGRSPIRPNQSIDLAGKALDLRVKVSCDARGLPDLTRAEWTIGERLAYISEDRLVFDLARGQATGERVICKVMENGESRVVATIALRMVFHAVETYEAPAAILNPEAATVSLSPLYSASLHYPLDLRIYALPDELGRTVL